MFYHLISAYFGLPSRKAREYAVKQLQQLLLYDEILQKDTVLRFPLSLRTGIFFAAQLYRTWTRSIFLQPKSTWQMKFDTFILCSIASLIPPYSRPAERGKRIQRVSQLPDISAKNMHSLARGSRGGSNSQFDSSVTCPYFYWPLSQVLFSRAPLKVAGRGVGREGGKKEGSVQLAMGEK